ncbi:hypothetical protein [Baekduia alba]|uniref:hypothetical protein n=1 Tax=Baekduia alba TaxID=2997333 RepID=UPI00233FA092|nr:hypothetical protein [Baekduia alba]
MRRERLAAAPALLTGLGLGVATASMLAVALMGLIVRPPLGRLIERVTLAALCLAAAALGVVLAADVGGREQLAQGVTLGALAYAAQVAVAPLLTRKLPRADRWHLALAQQNGITAIILSLTVAVTTYPAAGAVVAMAILTVTVLHALANTVWDLRQRGLSRKETS